MNAHAALYDVPAVAKTSLKSEGDNDVAVLWPPGDDINVSHIDGDVVTGGRLANRTDTPSAFYINTTRRYRCQY